MLNFIRTLNFLQSFFLLRLMERFARLEVYVFTFLTYNHKRFKHHDFLRSVGWRLLPDSHLQAQQHDWSASDIQIISEIWEKKRQSWEAISIWEIFLFIVYILTYLWKILSTFFPLIIFSNLSHKRLTPTAALKEEYHTRTNVSTTRWKVEVLLWRRSKSATSLPQ